MAGVVRGYCLTSISCMDFCRFRRFPETQRLSTFWTPAKAGVTHRRFLSLRNLYIVVQ